jgi:hypothetical protein
MHRGEGAVRSTVFAVFAILAGLVAGPAAAQQACTDYSVARGDTLRNIATRAYGDSNRFREIHDANRAVIGPRPELIEIGMVLRLPCADGSVPDTVAALSAPEAPVVPEAPAVVEDDPRTIRVAVIDGLPPLSSSAQPGLGLLSELVGRAVEASAPGSRVAFTMTRDLDGVLRDALPAGQHDVVLPVWRPDCPAPQGADDTARRLCDGFVFSAPLHQVVFGLYARADSLPAAPVVCVPGDYMGPGPAATGLIPAGGGLMPAPTTAGCLSAMDEGRADAILANPELLAGEAALVRSQAVTRDAALVLAVRADRPRSVEKLRLLETALRETMAGGDWPVIVDGAIGAWRMRLRAGG